MLYRQTCKRFQGNCNIFQGWQDISIGFSNKHGKHRHYSTNATLDHAIHQNPSANCIEVHHLGITENCRSSRLVRHKARDMKREIYILYLGLQPLIESNFLGFLRHTIKLLKQFKLLNFVARPQSHLEAKRRSWNKNVENKKTGREPNGGNVSSSGGSVDKKDPVYIFVLVWKEDYPITLTTALTDRKKKRIVSSTHMKTKKQGETRRNKLELKQWSHKRLLLVKRNQSTYLTLHLVR